MASIVFGGGITAMIGSHAGNTFSKNKGGAYIKKKMLGVNPRSVRQVANRTQIGQLSKEYTYALTDAQRAAWRTFASTYPVINRLGNTTFLSAAQMYAKLNAVVLRNGSPSVTLPPSSTVVGTPVSVVLVATSGGGGSLTVNLATTGSGGSDMAMLFLSSPLNPGKNYVSSQLRALPAAIARDTTVDITSAYLTLFGALPAAPGQRIFARAFVTNTTNGITSSAIQGSAMWS